MNYQTLCARLSNKDTSATDVYETYPEKEHRAVSSSGGGEDDPHDCAPGIERDAIDAKAARAAFRGATGHTVLEGAGEGPRARLLRLQMEADELAQEAVQSEEGTLPATLLQQVRTLQARLERMQVSTTDKVLNMPRELLQAPEEKHSSRSAPQLSPGALAALDARVAAVEERLGVQEIDGTELRPIIPTLEKLKRQMQLLSPAHLDAIRQRARLVTADLEQLSEAQKRIGDSDYEKLNSLYELQRQIEPLIPVAPALLARLQTLEGLHDAAATFSERLNNAEAASAASAARLGEVTSLLDTARTSLAENMEVIHGNLSSLESRISALDVRVAKLSSAPP